MVQGLTDKESLEAITKEAHHELHTSDRVNELAAKGLENPEQLTPDEIRELCHAVMRHIEHHKNPIERVVGSIL